MQNAATTKRLGALVFAVAFALLSASPAIAAGGTLELVPEPGLLLALLVFFVLMVGPVNQLIFKPLFRVLDARTEKIDGTRTRAQRLEREAEEVLERYQRAIREGRESSDQERRTRLEGARSELLSTTGAARTEAEGEIERARNEINASLDGARSTLRGQAEELARQAASQVLGRAL